jgi:hypothetical protein
MTEVVHDHRRVARDCSQVRKFHEPSSCESSISSEMNAILGMTAAVARMFGGLG